MFLPGFAPRPAEPAEPRPPVRDPAEALARRLAPSADWSVDVTLTRNRVRMLSIQFHGSRRVSLRAHEAFVEAPASVLDALGRYLRTRRRADWAAVSSFARGIPLPSAPAGAPRPAPAPRGGHGTRGAVFDLDAILDEVRTRFLPAARQTGIAWGRHGAPRRRRRRRSIQFGSYRAHEDMIHIHPVLDDSRVPPVFMRFLVYHELLHAVIPPVQRNGKWYHHHAEFRRREREFPNYNHMQEIQRSLLRILT